ncbi:MAG: peptidase T [Prolixibacteraceae bacterium]|jgi:tripeptide aminopeptidase|nr:peptidase T [Prolixibacteraceae bacterium]MBT6006386.1 peptidase T [Prolixibacteraceae bacterium]MBT6766029.1 peptidase T [Prolixibacteraceae bacterium]MBT7000618.1 peptidase T [Prolixibacteraceae bacterium]MBT7395550.1 peptidase T [Prolixibacteraceae bacterium]
MEKVVERFIKYAKQYTTSDPGSKTYPSTDRQITFMKKLVDELVDIGLSDVEMDKFGYVTATIPAKGIETNQVVGFVAHVDTSPDFSGENVNPQIIENYDGTPVQLKNDVTIDPKEFPEILNYVGQSIITADGTTLLGADDKAGVAEIVTAAEIILNSKNIQHGKIKLAFTPDEEVGHGTDHFDVKKFGADFAYTLDGGEIGELEFENFNAAGAKIKIQGRSVHPGASKNKMINAMLVAHKLIGMLPPTERPEHTEKYEGFYHLLSLKGTVESAELQYLIRDHNFNKFEEKKNLLKEVVQLINLELGKNLVELELEDQYFNMRQKIEPVMHVVEIAKQAMEKAGVEPKIKAIRGGTDGARLSYDGLPCPNVFAGGHNFHGPFEFVPIPSMLKSVEVILNIAELVGKMKRP